MASYFLVFLGVGVHLPYLPRYLAFLGWAGPEIGLVIGLQPLLRWTAAIGWAWAADRRRTRHRVLLACAAGGAAASAPLLAVREFGGVAAVLSAIAIAHGPIIPLLDATVIDNLDHLGGDYGRLRLWGSLSFIIGAFASAPLVTRFSPAIVPLLLFLPSLLLAPALIALPRTQHEHAPHLRAPRRLLDRRLTAFLATAFLVQMSCGAWTGFFAVRTTALGLSDAIPGLAWGAAVVGEVFLFGWGRRLLEWIAAPRLLIAVVVLTAARWALTGYAEHAALVVALQLGHAITFSAFHLAAQVLLPRLVPPESSSSAQALYGLAGFGLGSSTGLVLAGVLVDRIGTGALFEVEALLALAALVPALYIGDPSRRLGSA